MDQCSPLAQLAHLMVHIHTQLVQLLITTSTMATWVVLFTMEALMQIVIQLVLALAQDHMPLTVMLVV